MAATIKTTPFQVKNAALPGNKFHLNTNIDMFGGNQAKDMASLSKAIGGIADSVDDTVQAQTKQRLAEEKAAKEQQEKLTKQKNAVWRAKVTSDALSEWEAQLADAKGSAESGAKNFRNDFMQKWDDYATEQLQDIDDPMLKMQLEEDLIGIRSSLDRKAVAFQAAETAGKLASDAQAAIDKDAAFIRSNPDDYEMLLKQKLSMVEALAIPPEKRRELHDEVNNKFAKSVITNAIEKAPSSAIDMLNNGVFDDKISPEDKQAMLKASERSVEAEIKGREDAAKKLLKKAELDKKQRQQEKQDEFVAGTLYDNTVSDENKLKQLAVMELEGKITDGFASDARRVISTLKDVDAETNDDSFATIVQLINDANVQYGSNFKSGEYLENVDNIRKQILNSQANGLISQKHATKLYNTVANMTSKTVSEATKALEYEGDYKTAIEIFDNSVNPTYRGTALRTYFDRSEGKAMNSAEQRELALQVADEVSNEKRMQAQKTVDSYISSRRAANARNVDIKVNQSDTNVKNADISDADVMKKLGASEEDINYTMKQTGLSREEVFKKLRRKLQ